MLFPESRFDLIGKSLLDSIFSEPSFTLNTNTTAHKIPTDIRENEAGYELAMEVPGFDRNDLKLELKDGYLTVTANRSTESKEEEKGQMIRQERYYGSSKRSFYVGKHIEKEDIKAKYDKGILTVIVPKKEVKKIETKQSIEIQ